jgi:hypothetical protein
METEKFRLWTIDDIVSGPPPVWLIEPIFQEGSLVFLVGEPATGKSFIALSMALAIASGQEWIGRAVRSGPVVYVVGEGGRAIGKRIQAWQQRNGLQALPDAFFILTAPQLRNAGDVDLLLHAIGDKRPDLPGVFRTG